LAPLPPAFEPAFAALAAEWAELDALLDAAPVAALAAEVICTVTTAAELEAEADCETLAAAAALKPCGTTTIWGGVAPADATTRELVANRVMVNSRISTPR
jgi:hypothetical protein